MITKGTYFITLNSDGWTARTMDNKLAAQYEHTIAITAEVPNSGRAIEKKKSINEMVDFTMD